MKTIYTMSDAGGIAIGTESAWIIAPNGSGDGFTTVRICSIAEFEDLTRNLSVKFFTIIDGKAIEIIDYDCPSRKPWRYDGSIHDWKPLVTLGGRYGIYYEDDEIYLVQFDENPSLM